MKGPGLNREDYLLDIGCAYPPGGLHFIRYLDEGHYYGMDISQDALAEADRVDEQLDDDMFDFALAQSVFTYLPPNMSRNAWRTPIMFSDRMVRYLQLTIQARTIQ